MPGPDRVAFGAAVDELESAHMTRSSLCRPFLRVLPITGASISTLGAPFGCETICASDAASARLDELQFDLGEGPCWDAISTRRPVLAANIRTTDDHAWPVFLNALGDAEVGSLFAFPLTVGFLDIGAVDLYSRRPGTLTRTQVGDAVTLAGIAARQVLRRALLVQTLKPDPDDNAGFSRRVVHQATGMVLAQLDVPAADALLILRGHAFASGRTVRDVAADVVARRLSFSSDSVGS